MLILILFLLGLVRIAHCIFPFPSNGAVQACLNFECFNDHSVYCQTNNCILAVILSYNIAVDAYTSIYLGSILNLFAFDELQILTVVLQVPPEKTVIETGMHVIQTLNGTNSIFVSYEHGFSSFGLKLLEKMKKLGFGPTVVMHLNHEKPWSHTSGDSLDYIYESPEQLAASYNLHPLVLRNYYFESLTPHSYYIPAGIPTYSHLIGGVYRDNYLIPASKRGTFCHFRGRLDYFLRATDGVEYPLRDVVAEELKEPHVAERRELLRLAAAGRAGGCIAEEYDARSLPNASMEDKYVAYVAKMADTAFALCPSGNNPETFRLYEVQFRSLCYYNDCSLHLSNCLIVQIVIRLWSLVRFPF